MKRFFLGNFAAVIYIGEVEKEFTRSPFSPKPMLKNGDIVVLDKLHAYNLSKLLPTEFEMLDKNVIEVEEEDELLEIIEEFKKENEELEEVVAKYDLKNMPDEDILQAILDGLEAGTLTIESLSEYDLELYNNHINKTLESSSTGILEEVTLESHKEPSITPDEALKTTTLKSIEEFKTKEELEAYALEDFGLELDKRLTLENMYKTLCEVVNHVNKEEEK